MSDEQIIQVEQEQAEQQIDVDSVRMESDIGIRSEIIDVTINKDYEALTNKPSINGIELVGNKTSAQLGIVIPTNVSAFTNDAGYLTEHQDLSDYATEDYVDEAVSHVSIDAYTKSETNALLAEKADSDDLSAVALSGNYNDLSNKPTIPPTVTEQTVSDWGFTKNTGNYNKPSGGIPKSDLASAVQTSLGKADTALQSYTETDPVFSASVAHGISSSDITNWNNKSDFSGSYNDLTNKPTIPTVPTNVSAFTNDAGYLTQHQDISGKADAFTVGDGLDMTSQVLSNEQSIEYIVGTQTAATNVWKGVTKDASLRIGKVIAYYLPFAGTSTAATLNLTLADGSTTGAIALRRTASSTVTTQFAADNVIIMIYDGDYWKVAAYYDTNTNTIGYQVRTNSGTLPMTDIVYRYRLLFTSADNAHWVPANKSSSTNATAKRDTCQTPINPFGPIVYYGTTSSVSAGSSPSAANLWQQYGFALGYSFNRTGAALVLDFPKPIYLKCAPQSDGSAIIDADTPYVQALPSTEDGKIYIYLGIAYNATSIELRLEHPVYYYKNGAIRPFTASNYLPSVSAADNGKVLMVSSGAWTVASLPTYNGGVS